LDPSRSQLRVGERSAKPGLKEKTAGNVMKQNFVRERQELPKIGDSKVEYRKDGKPKKTKWEP